MPIFILLSTMTQQGIQTLIRLTSTETGFKRRELVDVRFVPALPGIAREL